MAPHPSLSEATAWVSSAPTRSLLRRRLFDVAGVWANALLGAGSAPATLSRLGVRVSITDLGRISGACRLDGDRAEVLVSRHDHPARQRFTAAHELGHLIMRNVDRAALELGNQVQERLCDAFAQRLLVPPDHLASSAAGWRGDPRGLLDLAALYGVGIGTIQHATADLQAARERLVIAAQLRGHPLRLDEVALRAQPAKSGDFFVPGDVRLSTLGLGQLDAWLDDRTQPHASGIAADVHLRLWRQHDVLRSGSARGPASWTALALGDRRLLVSVSTERLARQWSRARTSNEHRVAA